MPLLGVNFGAIYSVVRGFSWPFHNLGLFVLHSTVSKRLLIALPGAMTPMNVPLYSNNSNERSFSECFCRLKTITIPGTCGLLITRLNPRRIYSEYGWVYLFPV